MLVEDPAAIQAVHEAYVAAGVDVVTTATYQASEGGFARDGISGDVTNDLLRTASELARDAVANHHAQGVTAENGVLVAASVGPWGAVLADGSEFRGDYTATEADLERFHAPRFSVLARSGVDLLAIETIPSAVEARVLLGILDRHPDSFAWISFTCRDEQTISDGTPIRDVAALCGAHPRVSAVGVNCVRPDWAAELVGRIQEGTTAPAMAYPNLGGRWDASTRSWQVEASSAEHWLDCMKDTIRSGASIVGGCCRVGPDLIGRLRTEVVGRD